jgi:hypothetical protein
MARDYAKYRQPPKRNSWRQDWRGRLLLVLLPLFLIGIIILGAYLYKKVETADGYKKNLVSWVERAKSIFNHSKKTSVALFAKKPLSQKTGQEPDIHFSFYTELPNMHLILLK